MPMPLMNNNRRAFTLIELLIVTVILGVISLAIYSLIANGVKIWQRVNQRIVEEDLDIFLEKYTHDLKNCAKFSGVKFIGTPERLEFASIVNSPNLQRNTIGQILYVYDKDTKQLKRVQRDYSQIYAGEQGPSQPPLGDLADFKFSYYIQDKKSKERVWAQESPADMIPLAVRIELQLTHGTKTSEITRTVSIPVGG
jgi:prepilin-type N-terminal cleavage/methylation domain-containing protein